MNSLRPLLRVIRLVFTPLSLFVIAWFVWNARGTLGTVLAQGQWGFLSLAMLIWICSNILSPLVTTCIFEACGMRIGYRSAFGIHFRRLPAKYLPGGIWHTVGRANDYVEMGYQGKQLASLFILENLLLVLVTVFISTGLLVDLVTLPWMRALLVVAPPLAAIALVMLPVLANHFSRAITSIVPRPYFFAVLLLTVYWGLIGTAFVTFLTAFQSLQVHATAVQVAGTYIFSWMIGYVAIFAPQGIGVAEFVSHSLLGGGSTPAIIVGLLMGFRLLVLVADLASWVLGALTIKRSSSRS